MDVQYLTVMTLSTSFFASWKVLTPRECSMRSEKRQMIITSSFIAGEKSTKEFLTINNVHIIFFLLSSPSWGEGVVRDSSRTSRKWVYLHKVSYWGCCACLWLDRSFSEIVAAKGNLLVQLPVEERWVSYCSHVLMMMISNLHFTVE